jgi:integrase/recombinase XerD
MDEVINRFLHYLTVEKGLSSNTIDAYRNDLRKFREYLSRSGKNIQEFTKTDVISYLNHLRDSGNQTPTIARNMSSLRGLCTFLIAEGILDEDPLENLGTPKGWKYLPQIMGLEDVFTLLEKPKGEKFSMRDRAMLELIYSSGLRVSEIINLGMADINEKDLTVCVPGKGR